MPVAVAVGILLLFSNCSKILLPPMSLNGAVDDDSITGVSQEVCEGMKDMTTDVCFHIPANRRDAESMLNFAGSFCIVEAMKMQK